MANEQANKGLGRFKLRSSKHKPNPRHKPETKAEANLNSRRADYTRCIGSAHVGQSGLQQRIDSGDFHRPGA